MTQYCRYCSLASLQDDDLIYCEARKEIRDKKKIVSPNRCKQFEFNPVDVLNEEKDYKPRETKNKNPEGQGASCNGIIKVASLFTTIRFNPAFART